MTSSIPLFENPVYRLMSGEFRMRRRWLLWICWSGVLALPPALLYGVLGMIPAVNHHEAFALALLILHAAIWVGLNSYSILISDQNQWDMPAGFFRDVYLTALTGVDIAEAMLRARIARFGRLVLALIPFEISAFVFGFLLNPTPTRHLFYFLILGLFLADLFVSLSMSLIGGLATTVKVENQDQRRLRILFWSALVSPCILAILYWFTKGLCLDLLSPANQPILLTAVPLTPNFNILWPTGACLALFFCARFLHLTLWRYRFFTRRALRDYRDFFGFWLREQAGGDDPEELAAIELDHKPESAAAI